MKKKNYTAIGIAIGSGTGTALGVSFDNVGFWLPVGVGFGAVIGTLLSKKYSQ